MRNRILGHALFSSMQSVKPIVYVKIMNSAGHQNRHPPSKKPRLEAIDGERSWKVRASRESHDCINPVRSCEEIYFKEALEKRDKSKELIKVSIGESSPHYY